GSTNSGVAGDSQDWQEVICLPGYSGHRVEDMAKERASSYGIPEGDFKEIPEERLFFDPENPRLMGQSDKEEQSGLLEILWTRMGVDEVALSIANNGYFPHERLLVVPKPGTEGGFYVVEGNRRLAAVKLLRHEELRDQVKATLPAISKDARDRLAVLPCLVYRGRSELWKYMGFRHINGVKEW